MVERKKKVNLLGLKRVVSLILVLFYVTINSWYCNVLAMPVYTTELMNDAKEFLSSKGYTLYSYNIGTGSCGSVFLGEKDKKPFCIKFIENKLFSPYEFEIFTNEEINSCANITQAIEKFEMDGEKDSIILLITEFNEGGTLLNNWIKIKRNYSDIEIFKIVFDISKALKSLHSAGYIHRDVKPDNIMFSGSRYRLIDFGFVIPIKGEKNSSGFFAYRSPEFIMYTAGHQNDYDEKVDIWALGVMAYQLFTGEFPYKCYSFDKRLLPSKDIIENQTLFCMSVVPKIPLLSGLISRCLTFEAEDRISAKDLVKALRGLQHNYLQ